MAVTATASMPQANIVPVANHGANSIPVNWGPSALSASGSGLVLLAKIPINAKNVQFIGTQAAGATAQVINLGIRHGHSASMTVSAMGNMPTQLTAVATVPYTPAWDDAGGERHKYVVASKESGTQTVSVVITGRIFYDFYDR